MSPVYMASGSGDEEGNAEGASWRLIGPVTGLSTQRCRLVYSSLGHSADVCLFYVKDEFFAMDARCAHSGKFSLSSAVVNPLTAEEYGENAAVNKSVRVCL